MYNICRFIFIFIKMILISVVAPLLIICADCSVCFVICFR